MIRSWAILIIAAVLAAAAGGEGLRPLTDGEREVLRRSLRAPAEAARKYGRTPDGAAPAEQRVRDMAELLSTLARTMETTVSALDGAPPAADPVEAGQAGVVRLIDEILSRAGGGGGAGGSGGGGGQGTPSGEAPSPSPALPSGGTGTAGGGGSGAGGGPSADPAAPTGRQWGNLPEQTREEIMQILQEDIPLLYRELLRLYFRDLDRE
ncbi:MAG: hypothetical protein ABIF71_02970 [Planctomycetota bacterium]